MRAAPVHQSLLRRTTLSPAAATWLTFVESASDAVGVGWSRSVMSYVLTAASETPKRRLS